MNSNFKNQSNVSNVTSNDTPLFPTMPSQSNAQGTFMGAPIFSSSAFNAQKPVFKGAAVAMPPAQTSVLLQMGSFGAPLSSLGPQMNKPMLFGLKPMGAPLMPPTKNMASAYIAPQACIVDNEVSSDSVPVWIGPLHPGSTWESHAAPSEIFDNLSGILTEMRKEFCIDFEKQKNFVYIGRTLGTYDSAEFRIAIYRAESFDEPLTVSQYDTIVEIKRTYGCGFAQLKVTQNLTKQLSSKGLIICEEEQTDVFMPTLAPISFGDLDDFDMSDIDDESGMVSSDEESLTVSSPRDAAQSLINVVCNRNSFREEYRACASQLASHCDNDTYLNMIISSAFKALNGSPNIVHAMLTPLCDELYDTLIHVKILQFVNSLLKKNVSAYNNLEVSQMLQKLKVLWSDGVSRNVGGSVIQFIPSQTAVFWATECIKQLS